MAYEILIDTSAANHAQNLAGAVSNSVVDACRRYSGWR